MPKGKCAKKEHVETINAEKGARICLYSISSWEGFLGKSYREEKQKYIKAKTQRYKEEQEIIQSWKNSEWQSSRGRKRGKELKKYTSHYNYTALHPQMQKCFLQPTRTIRKRRQKFKREVRRGGQLSRDITFAKQWCQKDQMHSNAHHYQENSKHYISKQFVLESPDNSLQLAL